MDPREGSEFAPYRPIETVAEFYPQVRPQAVYERSLELLRRASTFDGALVTKSGIMVGLGEAMDELIVRNRY